MPTVYEIKNYKAGQRFVLMLNIVNFIFTYIITVGNEYKYKYLLVRNTGRYSSTHMLYNVTDSPAYFTFIQANK